jgi:hypothetical protein
MVKQAPRCLLSRAVRSTLRPALASALVPTLVATLLALVGATGCEPGRGSTIAAVTIEARCGSSADCPRGFECTLDEEHGPPTALCESVDPDASCPAGYDTKVVYGQTFCKLPGPALSPMPVTVRDARPQAARTGDDSRVRYSGL